MEKKTHPLIVKIDAEINTLLQWLSPCRLFCATHGLEKEDYKIFREKIEPLEPKVAKVCRSYKGCLGVSIDEFKLGWEDIRWADKNDPNHPVLKVQELTRKLLELRDRKERELEEEEILKTNEKKELNISRFFYWVLQFLRIWYS